MALVVPTDGSDKPPSRRAAAAAMGFLTASESRTAPPTRRAVAAALALEPGANPAAPPSRRAFAQAVNLALATHTVSNVVVDVAGRTVSWDAPPWTMPTRYLVEFRNAPTDDWESAGYTMGTMFDADARPDGDQIRQIRLTVITSAGEAARKVLADLATGSVGEGALPNRYAYRQGTNRGILPTSTTEALPDTWQGTVPEDSGDEDIYRISRREAFTRSWSDGADHPVATSIYIRGSEAPDWEANSINGPPDNWTLGAIPPATPAAPNLYVSSLQRTVMVSGRTVYFWNEPAAVNAVDTFDSATAWAWDPAAQPWRAATSGMPTGSISNKIVGTLAENQTHDFNFSGTNGVVTWSVKSGGGSITSNGVYTPPDVTQDTAVVVALLVDGEEVDTDTFTVTFVGTPVTVAGSISNKITELRDDATWDFNSSGTNGVVTWSVKSGGGSITSNGVYTPPDVTQDTAVVVALLVDGEEVDTDPFTVRDEATGSISNKINTLSETLTHDFNSSGTNGVVTWSVKSGGGSITSNGVYTPPDVTQDTAVVVALLVDGEEVDTDTFTVTFGGTPVTVAGSISNKITELRDDATWDFNSSGTNGVVTWSVKSGGGSINSSGLYTPAVVTGYSPVTVALMVDGIEVDTDSFNVRPRITPEGVISNGIAALLDDQTHPFRAQETNGVVTWSVKSGGGSITAAGLYTPPDVTQDTAVVVALLVDGEEVDTDPFTVRDAGVAPTGSISNKIAQIFDTDTHDFDATGTNGTVSWNVIQSNGGAIVATTGVYTPPDLPASGYRQVTIELLVDVGSAGGVRYQGPIRVDTDTFTARGPGPFGRITNKITSIWDDATHDFNAADANGTVTWQANGGTIDADGVWTPPDVPRSQPYVVSLLVDGTNVDGNVVVVRDRG